MLSVLFLVSFLWGTTFIFSKIVVMSLSPSYIVMLRFLLSFVFFVAVFKKRLKPDFKTLAAGGVIGIVNGAAMILQVMGLRYTTASNSAFITAVYIVFVPLIELLFWKKRQNIAVFAGIGITLAGVFLLSGGQTGNALNLGDMITFLCGLLFAFEIILISRWGNKHDVFGLVFMLFLFTSLSGALLVFTGKNVVAETLVMIKDPGLIVAMLFLSILGTFIPFTLQIFAQKNVQPTTAGIIYITESVFALILAVIFLHEQVDIVKISGIVLIMAGIYMTIMKNRKKREV